MKRIPLSQHKCALVDDEDFPLLSQHKWFAVKNGMHFYAGTKMRILGRRQMVRMHRFILGFSLHDGKQTDHIDGDGLNNQRSNLRICTGAENQHNQQPRIGYSSKYKGVSWHRASLRWRAQIGVSGAVIHLGLFNSEIRAALAYNVAVQKHFGEHGRLNRID